MATFYLDPLNGNDANDGLSFANRWKSFTLGATAARIAGGDTIRVMKSPDPTSLGSCSWVSDYGRVFHTKSISSSTNATPIAVTCASHGYSTGDWVYIASHTTNTNANGLWKITSTDANTFTLDGSTGNGVGGATGTVFRASNMIVTTPSAYIENIECHQNRGSGASAWTAANANVTTSVEVTQFLFSDNVQQILVNAAFTTGLAAYKSFASKDLSGYQQLSFMIRQTSGTVATAGQIRINLCSDTAGATPVDTFDVPALGALNTWCTFTVDKGSALGSAIQSVALYIQTDAAAQTFQLSNIISCKATSDATSINLRSLIGKNKSVNDADNDCWFGIRAIIGNAIVLAPPQGILINGATNFGYHGTSESVTTYKRETFDFNAAGTTVPAAAISSTVQQFVDSGTYATPIVYSGGWDSSAMTTQDGLTFLDGRNGFGVGISAIGTRTGNTFEKLGFVRFGTAMQIGASATVATDCYVAACATGISSSTAAANEANEIIRCKMAGVTSAIAGGRVNISGDCSIVSGDVALNMYQRQLSGTIRLHNGRMSGANVDDIQYTGSVKIWLPATTNSAMYGLSFIACDDFHFADVTINSESASSTNHQAIRCTNSDGLINASITGVNVGVSIPSGEISMQRLTTSGLTSETAFTQLQRGQLYIQSRNGGNPEVYGDGFTCTYQPSTAGANTNGIWECVLSSARRTIGDPVIIPICRMPVVANKLCTATLWVDTSNANATGGLFVLGGQVAGVSSNLSAVSGSTSWAQVTVTFTPTEAGVVELNAIIYSPVAATVSFDEFAFSQADQSWSVIANKLNVLQQGRIYIGPEAVTGGGGGPSGALLLPRSMNGGYDA